MDDDQNSDADLLALLSTRIGTIMEDRSVVALSFPALDRAERNAVLTDLEQASDAIAAMLRTMRCLMTSGEGER